MKRSKSLGSHKIGSFIERKPRSEYKTLDGWINSIYRANKAKIDEGYLGVSVKPMTAFRHEVKETMESQGLTARQAVYRLSRSDFTPKYDIMRENLLAGLKSTGIFNTFRKIVGWKEKIDPYKFEYLGKKIYTYENKVSIRIEDSPYRIIILNLQTGEETKFIFKKDT